MDINGTCLFYVTAIAKVSTGRVALISQGAQRVTFTEFTVQQMGCPDKDTYVEPA